MTPDPCPLNRAWCADHETDSDGSQYCRSADAALATGWMLTLTDAGDGPGIEISDPRGLLQADLVDPLDLPGALDFLAALAAMIRDATTPDALPQPARPSIEANS